MEKIKYIMTKPITMLVVIFIIVNLFTLFGYNIENNERKYSIKIINKIEQNKKLKLKEIEEDKLVVEELIGNHFDEYPLLNNIEVKNIENNIKKNRSLKYTIKNNSKNDIYITSEVLKRTINGKVEIPLIDFV